MFLYPHPIIYLTMNLPRKGDKEMGKMGRWGDGEAGGAGEDGEDGGEKFNLERQ
ncbi:MAG: hypothetical protein RH949_14510 [Coleofasciculus sp. A1-SPW-01]|uniref:hypothetical protein n=1 Tax=Coleofasciculus sp. A1-SPW-01 TaxID=3070819 RepID=UPI0032F80F0F